MKKLSIILCVLLLPTLIFAGGNKDVKEDSLAISRPSFQVFTDSLNRQIPFEKTLEKVIPGSVSAELYIYAIAPEKLASVSIAWPESSSLYISSDALSLPVTGEYNYYSSSLDLKKIKELGADAILIVGDPEGKEGGIGQSLDLLSKDLDLPIIYVADDFSTTSNTVRKLGKILSSEEQAEKVASLADSFMEPVNQTRNIVSVYYSGSVDGLTPVSEGSLSNQVIEYMGLYNPVPEGFIGSYTLDDIASLGADKILVSNPKAYQEITTNNKWNVIPAVSDKEVYLVPSLPFNILGQPNSIQRILGLEWLRNVTYSSVSDLELIGLTDEYFKTVMHTSLTDSQIKSMLGLK